MMKKFKLGKDILTLTVITLITVLTWVSFEVWLAATKTTITKITKEQMAALNPKVNTQIIDSLKDKLTLSAEEIDQLINTPTATQSAEEESAVQSEETVPEPEPTTTQSSETATESSQNSTESAILE